MISMKQLFLSFLLSTEHKDDTNIIGLQNDLPKEVET